MVNADSQTPIPAAATVAAECFAGLLRQADRIAFVTGAGMSTESGIPVFRSATGLYATGTVESTRDLGAFRRDPGPFCRFARAFLGQVMAAQPNAGHHAIAELQDGCGKDVEVATQNIDLLHQQSGVRRVYPVHGTVARV
jgi:NAD-dependent deacetylase